MKTKDKSGSMVGESHRCHGEIRVNSPKLWWPYLMSKDPGIIYFCILYKHIFNNG